MIASLCRWAKRRFPVLPGFGSDLYTRAMATRPDPLPESRRFRKWELPGAIAVACLVVAFPIFRSGDGPAIRSAQPHRLTERSECYELPDRISTVRGTLGTGSQVKVITVDSDWTEIRSGRTNCWIPTRIIAWAPEKK